MKYKSRLVILLTITVILEMLGFPSPITGTLVNLMLIFTTLVLNPLAGIFLGVLTPMIALIRGQLPAVLYPLVPAIIIGNIIYVTIFSFYRKRYFADTLLFHSFWLWLSIIAGSFLKFLWLYFSVTKIFPLLFSKTISDKIIAVLTFPQLLTAISGGILAVIFYQLLQKRKFL